MLFLIIYLLATVYFSWKKPAIALVLAANSYLTSALYEFVTGGSAPLSFFIPLFVFLTIVLLIVRRGGRLHYRRDFPDYLFLISFFLFIGSTFYSNDQYATLIYSFKYLCLGVSFYVFCKLSYSLSDSLDTFVNDFLLATFWVGVAFAFIALYYNQQSSAYIVRLTIGSSSSIPLAITLGLSLIAGIHLLLAQDSIYRRWLLLGFSALVAYAFVMTNTRSVVLGFALSMLYYLVISGIGFHKRNIFTTAALGIASVLGLTYIFATNPEVLERLVNGFDRIASNNFGESEGSRVEAWISALNLFYDNPILGIGAGVFEVTQGMYAHNMFLELLAESGLIGFLFFLFLILYLIKFVALNLKVEYRIFGAIFLYLLFVSQISLSLWMHKMLFMTIAMLIILRAKQYFAVKKESL